MKTVMLILPIRGQETAVREFRKMLPTIYNNVVSFAYDGETDSYIVEFIRISVKKLEILLKSAGVEYYQIEEVGV